MLYVFMYVSVYGKEIYILFLIIQDEGQYAMDLYIWQWVVRLLNKIKLGHGQKSLKNPALESQLKNPHPELTTKNQAQQ